MHKKLIQRVFLQVSQAYPSNIAIIESDRKLTYAELNQKINQLCWGLKTQNINVGDVIALAISPSIDYVIAVLAVLKSGAVFMPIDLNTPEHRLAYILSKTTPKLILSSQSYTHQSIPCYTIDQLSAKNHQEPDNKVTGDDSAYIIFTSGSTGLPKAIEGQHKGLSHFIHWEIKEFSLTDQCHVSWIAPPTFDVSLRDIFVPLIAGGTLCIPSTETRNNTQHLLAWIAQQEITLVHCVPSLFRLFIQQLAETPVLLPQLNYFLLAGEALYSKDVLQFRQHCVDSIELVNLYGPSETTLAKSFYRIPRLLNDAQGMIPIGQALSNTALLLIKNKRLCNIGEIGEIYIKTPFRSKGYYQDQALTDEVFVQNPLNPDNSDIIYKTGDLGRYLEAHHVAFLGRSDNQVKINGVRIELAEIEQALLKHPSVDQCVVIIQKDAQQQAALVCYFVTLETVDDVILKAHLKTWLPNYMLPQFFLALTKFPVNLHGKIDRKALPKPEALLYQNNNFIAANTDTEKQLVSVWQQILGIEKIGITHHFMDIGGDSLKAMRMVSGIYKHLQIDISLKDFFAHPTIRELAVLCDQSTCDDFLQISKITIADDYPVSHAQKRLWLMNQMQIDSVAYNLPESLLMEGDLDMDALQISFDTLIQRHESLRTYFVEIKGEPRQKISQQQQRVIRLIDLTNEDNKEEKIQGLIHQDLHQAFDLTQAPLLRVCLLKLAETKHLLLFNIHHIISDGWSLGVMTQEWMQSYSKSKQLYLVEPLAIQYKDYTHWQNNYLKTKIALKHKHYWLDKLAGDLPVLMLDTDYPRPLMQSFNGDTVHFHLSSHQIKAFKHRLKSQQASLFMGLTAVLKVLLFRYSEQRDIVIGTPIVGRAQQQLDEQVGLYVNTLALRNLIDPQASFIRLLEQVKATATEAFDHQHYPFDLLLEELKIKRDMSRSPLFDVMLVLQNIAPIELKLNDLTIHPFGQEHHWTTSRFDLTFHFNETAEGLNLALNFNTDIFSISRIQRLGQHFINLLDSASQSPQNALTELTLLSAAEIKQLTSKPDINHLSTLTLSEKFDQQAVQTPDNIALVSCSESLSYHQLQQKVDQLSRIIHHALDSQRSTQAVVGIYSDQVEPIFLLACLKATVIYLPLESRLPVKRLAHMLEISDCQLIISRRNMQIPKVIVEQYPLLYADDDNLSEKELNISSSYQDIAYILFTSGSTGQPKGVMISHQGFINMILTQIKAFACHPNSRVLQFSSIAFDASLSEIFMALFSGASLYLSSLAMINDTAQFIDFIKNHKITHITLPPVYLKTLQQQALPSIETLITAGEAAFIDDALYYAKSCRYINAYGPTEASVCASFYQVDNEKTDITRIPIGKPLAHLNIFILDSTGHLVPYGVTGEMYISGVGVAKGYIGQEQLTAQRFITLKYLSDTSLYKTGDLAFWNEHGEIEYVKRNDSQIKISGYRIETQEIVYALTQHPEISHAYVMVHNDTQGQHGLSAYYIKTASPIKNYLSIHELRDHLALSLPHYMLPQHFIEVDKFPVNNSGKIDRKALPKPSEIINKSVNENDQIAMTETEQQLVTIWQAVLDQSPIGIHDHYFHRGGDSIRAIQIVARLRDQGLKLEVRDIFQYPTINELATRVRVIEKEIDQSPVRGEIPLTPIQQWFLKNDNPVKHHFNQAILLIFNHPLNKAIVQQTLDQLQTHHDALRMRYRIEGTNVIQEITNDQQSTLISELDLHDEVNPEQTMRQHADKLQACLDLSGDLFQAAVYRLKTQDYLLLFSHHLIIDGVSWRILLEDFSQVYEQLFNNQPIALNKKTDAFKTHAQVLLDYAQSDELLQQVDYWQTLAKINQSPSVITATVKDTDNICFSLSEIDTQLLLADCHKAFNTRVDDILLAALALSFFQWQGTQQLLIELEGHGRHELVGVNTQRTVGWFTSAYPHLLFCHQSNDLAQLIKITKESLRKIPEQGLSYGVLCYLTNHHEVKVKPEICFNYLGQFETKSAYGLFSIDWQGLGQTVNPQMPLTHPLDFLSLVENNSLQMIISFNKQRYQCKDMEQLGQLYQDNLRALIGFCVNQTETEMTPADLTFQEISMEELDSLFDDELN